ncbi:malignant fibrous histiocytoma-amplified sequence 1 homolog isoform X2 [Physella acuta]|uniref:malignant fibrous histiocytoma-amplified sequence 1 homolog isoform X2 n=1 Tax=Physella acuta TaxID=109671 RepID=UPI0027DB26E7|nr:malignant fibrous histiocytoma-amplified sequence 1 homolog isoform X2 [Physella acuta]
MTRQRPTRHNKGFDLTPTMSTKSPRRNSTRDNSPSKTPKLSPTAHRKSISGDSLPPRHLKSPPKSGRKSSASHTMTKLQTKAAQDERKKKTAPAPEKVPELPKLTESGLRIVDMSGQGMTSVPSSLINSKDIGHLILSSNNLRSLPPEIKQMTTLEKLDLSKNGLKCSNSNDFSGLPQDMALLTNLTELNISECNLPFVPPAIFKISSLKVLDLSRNKVNILLPDIGQLKQLTKLSLQQTNITSLPPELAYCQDLEEIYLWGNTIETLPETLPEMPRLRVLALNYRSFCSVVDTPYMENLLRKGQIKSEHIPSVVFELPAIQILDLESTKLNTLPEISNTQLQEFYLSNNFLQTIPPGIFKLRQLRLLDLSHNLLTELTDSIGDLVGLKVLRLANNSLEVIPATLGNLSLLEELNLAKNRIKVLPREIKDLKALKILILETNRLEVLPEEVCGLTQLHTLDLTSNEIRSLPIHLFQLTNLTKAHCFHQMTKSGLWLYKNPLEQPPPEVWRTQRPEHIFEYLKKLLIMNTVNLQRQKIEVLGETQSGKTSLVQSMTQRKSMLTGGLRDRTRLVQHTKWETENKVKFAIHDFGGDNTYQMLYKTFLDSTSLKLIVYNAATFSEKHFYHAVGQWLDLLSTCTPGAVVKIIGTHVDQLNFEEDDDETKTFFSSEHELKLLSAASVDLDGEEENDAFSESVNDQNSTRITSTPLVPDPPHHELVRDMVARHLSQQEEQYQQQLKIIEKDIAKLEKSGSSELTDIEEAALKMLRVRQQKIKDILLHPLRILPGVASVSSADTLEGILPLIDELEHIAIDKSLFPHAQSPVPGRWKRFGAVIKQSKGFYVYWEDMEVTAHKFDIQGDELKECIKYLHNTDEVLWYDQLPGLSEIVFHKPRFLVEIFASLFRHDIAEFLQYENKVFLSRGRLKLHQFQDTANLFIQTGQISRPLLNCLWFDLNLNNDSVAELLELLPLFDICFAVPEPDVPTGPLYARPLLVLPWYNRDTDTSPLQEVWPKVSGHKELAVIYEFEFHFPPEIFSSVSVQLQDVVDERMDWKDHIYACSETEKLLLQHSTQGSTTLLTVLVRGPEFAGVQDFMEELVDMINTLLLKYPGLYWKLTIPMGASSLQLLKLGDNDGAKNYTPGRRGSRLIKPMSFKS